MIELIREQKDLIPEKYLHQSSIKNLKLHKNEFSSLLADAERQVLEGSSFVLCCGEKINGTISELLRKKITDSTHFTKSLTLSESPSYDVYEEIFKKAVFTPDECHLVRDSLVQDGIKPEKNSKNYFLFIQSYRLEICFMPVHKHFMLLMITLHLMCVAPL